MCQIWKTRIEIRANIAAHINAHKATRFAVENWCNKTIYIPASYEKAKIDPINVELEKFGIYIKTSFADGIYKTCHK